MNNNFQKLGSNVCGHWWGVIAIFVDVLDAIVLVPERFDQARVEIQCYIQEVHNLVVHINYDG